MVFHSTACTNWWAPPTQRKGVRHYITSPKKEKVNGHFVHFTILFQLDKLKALFRRKNSQKVGAFYSKASYFQKGKRKKRPGYHAIKMVSKTKKVKGEKI